MNNVTNEMLLDEIQKITIKANLLTILPGVLALFGVIITLIIQQINLKKTNKEQKKQEILTWVLNLIRDCREFYNEFTPKKKILKYVNKYDEIENDIDSSEFDYNQIEYIFSKIKDSSVSKSDIKTIIEDFFEQIKKKPEVFEWFKEELIEKGHDMDSEIAVLVKPNARKYLSDIEFYLRRAQLIKSIQDGLTYLNVTLPNNKRFADLLPIIDCLKNEISVFANLRDMSETLSYDFIKKVDEIEDLSKRL
ncbi:hypothetical protein [Streptococcus cristatus]|uniref:hypothetical protein n=1 Tax=Streptococcus cristatus TaxID=45634 RepID=UPI0028D27F66|nr:hypothetical protein [Streptococcus cristatus]